MEPSATVEPTTNARTSAGRKSMRDAPMIEAAERAGVDTGRRAAGKSAAR